MLQVKDLFKVSKGKKVSSTVEKSTNESVRYIQIGDLRTDSHVKFTEERNLVSVNESDLVIAWDGAYSGLVGFGLSGIIGSTLARLRIQESYLSKIEARYAGYFLHSKFNYLQSTTTGATIPHISRKALEGIEITIPNLQTQRQIVAALDKAKVLIDKRQKSIEMLDEFIRATFFEMFGDPYVNEKKWQNMIIDDVVKNIQAGWSAVGEQREKNEDEFGVLKISAVTSGRFKSYEHKTVTENKISRKLVIPEKGDVLFSRANTMDLVAATCIVDSTNEKLFLPDKLWKIHLNKSLVTPEYFVSVLQSPTYKKNLALKSTGSSGSMMNISQKKLLAYMFPKPELNLQRKYSLIYKEVEAYRIRLVESLEKMDNLFQSLLQRAFHGDLSFDIELQLNAFLESEDYKTITEDIYLIQELVDRFNQHNQKNIAANDDEKPFKFESLFEYDKAKRILLGLLKENKVVQKYDKENKQTKISMP
jgi:type I restriction enzyme S subunit